MSGLLPSFHSLFLLLFFFLCFHCTTATTDKSTLQVIISTKKSTKPNDKPTGRQSGSILGGETCFTNSECVSNVCAMVSTSISTCPPKSFNCVCIGGLCTDESDCQTGESCFAGSEGNICVSDNGRILKRPGSLTLGPCSSTADCATERDCFGVDENKEVVKCKSGSSCVCLPLVFDQCSEINSSVDCETDGETCAKVSGNTVCVDPKAAVVLNNSSSPQANTTPVPTPKDPENPSPGTGLTLDLCNSDSACAAERKCKQVSEENGFSPCGPSALICGCVPPTPVPCNSDSDCVTGETCFSIESVSLCISKSIAGLLKGSNTTTTTGSTNNTGSNTSGSTGGSKFAQHFFISVPANSSDERKPSDDDPKPSGDDPGPGPKVCIAATELAHLPSHKLLYPDHVHASVLCDKYGSCATPGHIVHYNGSPMMMKTYCGLWTEGCEKKITPVNSPRWSRKLRINSKSPGLEYTAFAARYETNAEERLLQTAIRFGL